MECSSRSSFRGDSTRLTADLVRFYGPPAVERLHRRLVDVVSVLDGSALHQKDDILRDVRRQIRDAFQILGYQEKLQAASDALRVLDPYQSAYEKECGSACTTCTTLAGG